MFLKCDPYRVWCSIFYSKLVNCILLGSLIVCVKGSQVALFLLCVAVATLANEKLLERASDFLLCRKSTSNKTRYGQWFDRCIISKMILKSGSNWLFPVVFSVEITLSRCNSRNSFELNHRPTGFLNYALFCLSCLLLNLKPVNYLTRRSSMAKDLFLSFFGNANGHTQQKTTKSYDRDDNRKFKSEWFTQFTWLEVEEAKDKG